MIEIGDLWETASIDPRHYLRKICWWIEDFYVQTSVHSIAIANYEPGLYKRELLNGIRTRLNF